MGSDEEVVIIAELVSVANHQYVKVVIHFKLRKSASGARGDDTKSLKGAILNWITPKGWALIPPLSWNVKIDQGFNHEVTGALLCPTDLDWSNQEWVTFSSKVEKAHLDSPFAGPKRN